MYEIDRELNDKRRADIKSFNISRTKLNDKINKLITERDELKSCSSELKKLIDQDTFVVTDHAIVRYFERVLGFDISEIRKQILPREVLPQLKTLGGKCKYPINGDKPFQIVVEDNTVVTLITD